jgi:acetyltransferase-like isoleucine patch superfamily enzyme
MLRERFIFLPNGFSCKSSVLNFSGRQVDADIEIMGAMKKMPKKKIENLRLAKRAFLKFCANIKLHTLKHKFFFLFSGKCYFHKNITFERNVYIHAYSKVSLGTDLHIGRGSYIRLSSLSISSDCAIGPGNVFYGKITIGKFLMTGPNVVIAGGMHGMDLIDTPMIHQSCTNKGRIVIEDDVWIGANAVILDGVTIREGAVIGAGSIVTKDVPSFSIVAGNPARVIKQRSKVNDDS